MASWGEIERKAPQPARDARNLLEVHVHKTIATLRADGSPRISGIEAKFIGEGGGGGAIPDPARKLAIFKAMGAEEVDDASALHRVDVRELAVTRLTEAKGELAVAWWTEAGGERRTTRK